jgi:predicted SAM-dependent methyltransferase
MMDEKTLETAEFLNAGCGTTRFDNCINLDVAANPLTTVDIIGSVLKIPFPKERFKGVIFSHVLEHLLIREHRVALCEINRVLKPQGTLYLEVPNFEKSMEYYLSNFQGRADYWYQCIYGREDYASDIHKSGIGERYLTDLLFDSGFANLKWIAIPEEYAILAVVAQKANEFLGERI